MDESTQGTAPDLAKNTTLLDAIELLEMAWEDVKAVSIRNCWAKGGLKVGPSEEPQSESEEIPVSTEIWERWLDIDRDAPVAGPLIDEDIVSEIMTVDTDETEVIDIDSDENDVEVQAELPPTNREMREAMDTLKRGLKSRGFNDFVFLNRAERILSNVLADSLPQAKVDKFFGL